MSEIVAVRFSRQELDTLSKELQFLHAHLAKSPVNQVRRMTDIATIKYLIDRELAGVKRN